MTDVNPLVSIASITYNQARYIRDAIEGFLMQKTDFSFEIILHDDASTDGTVEILQEYAAKFPQKIRLILQRENQHSQGKNVQSIPALAAKGEYIALCDGDDYWIDPYKLQKQIDAMRQHPECDASFHSAYIQSGDILTLKSLATRSRVFTARETILGGGGMCPTASLIFKKSIFNQLPPWFFDAPIGDYFLQILGALKGGLLYINDPMVVYRDQAVGSWSLNMRNEEALLDWYFKLIKSLDAFDVYSTQQFQKELAIMRRKISSGICRHPKISFAKRRMLFLQNKQIFHLKDKLLWWWSCVRFFLHKS